MSAASQIRIGNPALLIFLKEKIAFLAIPKTGTTAIESALESRADIVISNPAAAKHASAKIFYSDFTNLWGLDSKIETVAVMREPLDRLASWYRYRMRPELSGHSNSTEGISFNSFVNSQLLEDTRSVGLQSRFLSDNNNELIVDHVFDYARIDQLLRFFEDRLAEEIIIKQENASPKKANALKPETEQAYRKARHHDFALYNHVKEMARQRDAKPRDSNLY